MISQRGKQEEIHTHNRCNARMPTMLGVGVDYALLPPTRATCFFAAAVGATVFIITTFAHLLVLTTVSRYNILLIGIAVGFLFMNFSGILHYTNSSDRKLIKK